jgi:acetyl esterase/lipase
VFVSGHSAGAYSAVMLGSDARYVKAFGGDFSWMRGVIGIAGPYDFLPLTDKAYIDMFHGADNRAILPITYIGVAKDRPPMLLVTGAADGTVGPGNTTRMAAAVNAHGGMAEAKLYPGIGHIGIILSLLPPLRGYTPLREDMLKFIQSHS